MSQAEPINDDDSTQLDRQLDALRSSLELPLSELKIDDLMPILVPSSFFEQGNWPGPFERVNISGVGMTWAVLQPENTMLYLSHALVKYWEAQGIDWRERAFDNLSAKSEQFSTGYFESEDGSGKSFALVFMHEDGLGPSRLLFDAALKELFPEGYKVAIPEMSCGIAISVDATEEELARVTHIIAGCFDRGTRPLVPGLHSPIVLA